MRHKKSELFRMKNPRTTKLMFLLICLLSTYHLASLFLLVSCYFRSLSPLVSSFHSTITRNIFLFPSGLYTALIMPRVKSVLLTLETAYFHLKRYPENQAFCRAGQDFAGAVAFSHLRDVLTNCSAR